MSGDASNIENTPAPPPGESTAKTTTEGIRISRRDFLKVAGVFALGYGAYKYDRILSGLFGTEYEKSTEQAKKYIRERYGLDIIVGLPVNSEEWNITGDIPNAYELSRGLILITEELIKYPPDLLKNGGVKAIRFLRNAKVEGVAAGGFVSEFSEGVSTICYEAEPFELGLDFIRAAFHHELFHLLDANDGGFEPDDEQWRSIYNCGGCKAYWDIEGIDKINQAERRSTEPNWFISQYGQRNPVEDRAEFAETVMMPISHQRLLQRIEREKDEHSKTILRTKYEATKQYYLKWSKGLMNENYWRDLIDGNVKGDYFSFRL